MRVAILCSLALGCLCNVARAQTLSNATDPMGTRVALDVGMGAALRSGNATTYEAQLGGLLRLAPSRQDHRLAVRYAYAQSQGERYENALGADLQLRRDVWGERLGLLAVAQYDRSEQRRRLHLLQSGAGLYVRAVRRAEALLWEFSAAYLFEFEKFAEAYREGQPGTPVRDSLYEVNAHRVQLTMDIGWRPGERFSLGWSNRAQVPLSHCACDTRVLTSLFLRTVVHRRLSVETQFAVRHDPRPARRVQPMDALLRTGLVLTLR